MPSLFEGEDRRELLILDTGPIRELILFRAVDQLRFEGLRNDLKYIFDRASYIRCTKFIGLFNRKTTSASVVAELNSWIRGTERRGQESLWNQVYDEFRAMRMDEEVVRLLEMEVRSVTTFGPVDVSLLKLAQRHETLSPLVLTIDSGLQGACEKAGVHVRNLLEIT